MYLTQKSALLKSRDEIRLGYATVIVPNTEIYWVGKGCHPQNRIIFQIINAQKSVLMKYTYQYPIYPVVISCPTDYLS